MDKSRDEILLDEKVEQIDDINFDKLFDSDEMTSKSLESFSEDNISNIENLGHEEEFSIEVSPSEFLENREKREEKKENKEEKKPKFFKKSLFVAFTSIAVLLCILFVYNVFQINSLQFEKGSAYASAKNVTTTKYEENNFVTFEDGSKLKIEEDKEEKTNTNWFDSVIDGLNQMFGGNY